MAVTNLKQYVGKEVTIRWHDAFDKYGWRSLEKEIIPDVRTQWGYLDKIENGYARVLFARDESGTEGSFTCIPLGIIESIRISGDNQEEPKP